MVANFFYLCKKITNLKMSAKNLFFSYWKSILVIIGILYLSFTSPSTFESVPRISQFPHSDKIVHFVMFFVLTAVLIYEFQKSTKGRRHETTKKVRFLNNKNRSFVLLCFVFPIALGGLIEILQKAFFPRSAEWLDWAADIAGVLTAWAIFLIAKSVRAKNLSPLQKSKV